MRGPFHYVYLIYALFRVDTRVKHRTIRHAITHLMNKALPQRCQIRNLKEIVQQYIGQYPKIRVFMESVFAPLEISSEHVMELLDNQHMLFMFLKLFVVSRVDEIPPLVVHLQGRCNWRSFSDSVKLICHRVQKTIQQNLSRGVHLLENVESVIVYMSRIQVRNIMSPCFMHLLQTLFGWSDLDKTGDIVPRTNALTNDPISILSSRILENYGMSMFGAHYARECMQMYLKDANKNNLHEQLNKLSEADHAYFTWALCDIKSRRIVSVIPNVVDSSIHLYLCCVCHDVKNTLTTFTSLRDIMYDAEMNCLYCVKKREKMCRERQLKRISMHRNYVVLGLDVYCICRLCGILHRMPTSRYSQTGRLCDTCRPS